MTAQDSSPAGDRPDCLPSLFGPVKIKIVTRLWWCSVTHLSPTVRSVLAYVLGSTRDYFAPPITCRLIISTPPQTPFRPTKTHPSERERHRRCYGSRPNRCNCGRSNSGKPLR